MEVRQNSNAGGPEHRKPRIEGRSDITRSNRLGIAKTVEDLERAREMPPAQSSDEVSLSAAGQLFAGQEANQAGPADDQARSERVAELREAYLQGTLNTPERIEQAATNLLAPPA